MAKVMNRAARRAANSGMEKALPTIQVTHRVDLVPMEHMETFFKYEIAREGKWRNDAPVLILRPKHDAGLADSGWFPKTLARMWEVRQRKDAVPLSGDGMEIDLGLIDIIVFFELMPGNKRVHPQTAEDIETLRDENFNHLDKICGDSVHDQMIIAQVEHFYHSDGSYLCHYHTLIFNLRQDARGKFDVLRAPDLQPLLNDLRRGGNLNVIEGVKQ